MKRFLTIFLLLLLAPAASAQTVTFASLLDEMADRTVLTRRPEPGYVAKAATSYDRESKVNRAEDGLYVEKNGRDWGKGWFANRDFGQFLRTEQVNGRTEYVLMDDKGPGAIVRWWSTAKNEGVLRIYLDDDAAPAIEGKPAELVGGDSLAPQPFSFKASDESTNPDWRGHNLYLPIPYQKRCKVTWEGKPSYYQIGYRKYDAGTRVKTFSRQQITEHSDAIQRAATTLVTGNRNVSGDVTAKSKISLAPNASVSISVNGAQAITRLRVRLSADNLHQALRSTVLTTRFDDQDTAWLPVGSLGGIGYSTETNDTYYVHADGKNGLVTSYYVMPFRQSAVLTLTNHGSQPITVEEFSVTADKYQWDERSLYWHGTWFELRNISTQNRSDLNYVTVQGAGRYVGTSITIFNTCTLPNNQTWWGEGDDKVYVDGEEFPSIFGTGTEDYFGYAYCRPQRYSTPFISQPRGEGNKKWGYTNNNRYHLLDDMPFSRSIQFDMEIWHPFRKRMNYAAATFFYGAPGAAHNVRPDVAAVQHAVAIHRDEVLAVETPSQRPTKPLAGASRKQ